MEVVREVFQILLQARVRIGSVGFIVRLVPPSCSLILEKSKGWSNGRFGCLKRAKALCVLMRYWRTISYMSPPVGFGVAGSTVIDGSSFDVVVCLRGNVIVRMTSCHYR
jgi:hypothetical protein